MLYIHLFVGLNWNLKRSSEDLGNILCRESTSLVDRAPPLIRKETSSDIS